MRIKETIKRKIADRKYEREIKEEKEMLKIYRALDSGKSPFDERRK